MGGSELIIRFFLGVVFTVGGISLLTYGSWALAPAFALQIVAVLLYVQILFRLLRDVPLDEAYAVDPANKIVTSPATQQRMRKKMVEYLRHADAVEYAAGHLDAITANGNWRGGRTVILAIDNTRTTADDHRVLLDERMRELGSSRSRLAGFSARSSGMLNRRTSRRSTPVDAVRNAYAVLSLLVSSYRSLETLAQGAGDEQTADLARKLAAGPEAAADTLAHHWGDVADLNIELSGGAHKVTRELLRDAQRMESDALAMAKNDADAIREIGQTAGVEELGLRELSETVTTHCNEIKSNVERLDARLKQLHLHRLSSPKRARFKVANGMAHTGQRLRPDSPIRGVSDAYALEHLELATFELLARVARLDGDEQTAALADKLAIQARCAINRIDCHRGDAVELTLMADETLVAA